MIRQLTFIIFLFTILFFSCQKSSFVAVKVTYFIKIADSNTVNISYNSDYYYNSGTRKTVSYTSHGGIWVASHIANKPEDYYIKVDYTGSLKADTNYQVKVIFNDTLVKDSAVFDSIVTPVELSGTVSK